MDLLYQDIPRTICSRSSHKLGEQSHWKLCWKLFTPASIVATVVSHGSETCPNMGDDWQCVGESVPNGWKFPVWVDRLHSMFVFFVWVSNPHVQLILIDIPW